MSELDGLEKLDEAFEQMLQKFPEKRRDLVEKAGERMYQKVQRNIAESTTEHTGRLKKGCYMEIGSKGGYAAVRNRHATAPHAHLIEFGHRIMRGAKIKEGKHGQTVKIKGSGKMIGWAAGKHMYRNALNELEGELVQEAEKMIAETVGEIF